MSFKLWPVGRLSIMRTTSSQRVLLVTGDFFEGFAMEEEFVWRKKKRFGKERQSARNLKQISEMTTKQRNTYLSSLLLIKSPIKAGVIVKKLSVSRSQIFHTIGKWIFTNRVLGACVVWNSNFHTWRMSWKWYQSTTNTWDQIMVKSRANKKETR